MKLLGLILGALLGLIQYPLWIGPGSWFRVWELDSLLTDQQARNAGLRLRNEGLEAELEDLRNGRLAIEERARYSLGMIRDDEIFVQLNPVAAGASVGPAAALAAPAPAPGAAGTGSGRAGATRPVHQPSRAPSPRVGADPRPGVLTVGAPR
ncbi:MAG: cell division protein FtsB [Lautropia sp.]